MSLITFIFYSIYALSRTDQAPFFNRFNAKSMQNIMFINRHISKNQIFQFEFEFRNKREIMIEKYNYIMSPRGHEITTIGFHLVMSHFQFDISNNS